jgi:tRNA A-37 threonylcarbamoyl transferase component Bud32
VAGATKVYGLLVIGTVALEGALAVRPLRALVTGADGAVLRGLERLRVGPLTTVLRDLLAIGGPWPVRVLFWGTVVALVLARRVHHLVTYLFTVLTGTLLVAVLAVLQGRMRPPGIDIAGDWSGYAHPSRPVAQLCLVLVGAVLTLVPTGRWRVRATVGAATLVGLLCLARLYLAVDAPTDVLAGIGLGWALPMVLFAVAVPPDVFLVRYGGGPRAHVELAGRRTDAIVQALEQQLGLQAIAVEPFGLAGSAGSMPLRVTVRDPDGTTTTVFGKLLNVTHLRADRWYKLARMVLYGRLEDEKPFSTVRRLVEYEDHMLRYLRDAHLPVPRPYGFVEITPEREYVVLMECFDGAAEIGAAELTDEEIDEGLRIVRRLWEAGVAHRDLKPSNLLVRDGRVLLIDVAFAALRPTPWRQAVDLANMMLTLGLASSAERVYSRALLQFAPVDVAEAFAVSRSLTLPTQLRARLRADGRHLGTQFRGLAPHRAPLPIQVWSLRRVWVTFVALATAVTGVAGLVLYARVVNLL